MVNVGREYNVRLMGPNMASTIRPNLCATFCTMMKRARWRLSSQSGGVGMAIIGFSRSAKWGISYRRPGQ